MRYCKNCHSERLTKNGKNKFAKQRYKCSACGGTFIEGDARCKYGLDARLKAIGLYLKGHSLRSIERSTKVSNSLILEWCRDFDHCLGKIINKKFLSDQLKNISLIKLDELVTEYNAQQGKLDAKPLYGLLITKSGTKLLISK